MLVTSACVLEEKRVDVETESQGSGSTEGGSNEASTSSAESSGTGDHGSSGSTDAGDTVSATAPQTDSSTTLECEEGPCDPPDPPVPCGDDSCGRGEVCVQPIDDCQCDDTTQTCESVELAPSCAAIPSDCVIADDVETCLASLLCEIDGVGFDGIGAFMGNVLVCEATVACEGRCDISDCGETSGSESSSGG